MGHLRNHSILLFALAFLASSPALADYHYASHEGSNEYPYTSWETAADSIQKAIDASSPHDTVYVGSGDWLETVATGYYDSVAIIGRGMDSTFWYGDSTQTPVLTIDYNCSVENITFEHLNDWFGIRSRAYAGVKINNCKFFRSRDGIQSAGGPSEITNCVFDSCGMPIDLPIWLGNYLISNNMITHTYGNWAIYLQVDTAVVQNNIIVNDSLSWVSCVAGAPDYAVIQNNVAIYGKSGFGGDTKINNTALHHNRDSQSTGLYANVNDTLINNTTMASLKGITILADDVVINYNSFWNNEIDIDDNGYVFDSIGNIFCDPMHVSKYDVHLQAFSPLIDAGDPGILDVDGSRSDIGAYGGPYGESYQYSDLPPNVPDSLAGRAMGDSIVLNWRFNSEADFSNYLLYRDTVSGFEPSVFNLVAEPDTSHYADFDIVPGYDYYYRISALDNQGNESGYSDELEVITTGIWGQEGADLPRITTIETSYPNPFNTGTTIIYSVADLGPIPAQINIDIYDIMGRKVKTLVDERKEVGIHKIVWRGRDDSGHDCPTGVYFARITQWGVDYLSRHRKLVLIR
jgi:hypothetical protein